MTTRPLDPNIVLDRALADPLREHDIPRTPEQRANLRYWDFFIHDLWVRMERQKAIKEAAAKGDDD
jgi:hypothetical protein